MLQNVDPEGQVLVLDSLVLSSRDAGGFLCSSRGWLPAVHSELHGEPSSPRDWHMCKLLVLLVCIAPAESHWPLQSSAWL